MSDRREGEGPGRLGEGLRAGDVWDRAADDRPAADRAAADRAADDRAADDRAAEAGAHVGRDAEGPTEIPARGWWQVTRRVWSELGEDDIGFLAAAIAYYAIFAVFPALVAAVSVWGIFADPRVLARELAGLTQELPGDVAALLADQLSSIAATSGGALGAAAVLGLLVALYSASKGILGLMNGLNLVYEERERRGFFRRTLTSVVLTLCGLLFTIVSFALLAVLPPVLEALGLGRATETLLNVGRWPLLGAAMIGFLATVYRFGPSRARPRWQWVTPGAILATVVWLVGSAAFTFYVARFGKFNETYGALGAGVVLLLWLWLTGYALLLGGELNAELERQTARDSTTGPPLPMGRRGAYVADHLPEQ